MAEFNKDNRVTQTAASAVSEPGFCFASLCLVANAVEKLEERLVFDLAAAGWQVHVLWCSPTTIDSATLQRFTSSGVHWNNLVDLPKPKALHIFIQGTTEYLTHSNRVRHALEQLHRNERFDCIMFPDAGALGFRTVQAKRAGLAFLGVELLVTLHGPSGWEREKNHEWLARPDDLRLDYCERYAFDYADGQAAANAELLDQVSQLGWKPRATARIAPDVVWLTKLLHRQEEAAIFAREAPLVTVVVAHYNLGDYLPETLASLGAQTYANLEVIIVDDGSTCAKSQRVFEALQKQYPQFRFLTQANAGPGVARNRGLAEAKGEYFISVDADNVALPQMVERFVTGMQRAPETSVLTCFWLSFTETSEIAQEKYLYACTPVGGPVLYGVIENIFGDTNAVFRTADLRAVGGYETQRATPWEDWETFLKIAGAGYRVDVIPDYLFLYRVRAESRLLVMTDNWQRTYEYTRRLLQILATRLDHLSTQEKTTLLAFLISFQKAREQHAQEQEELRRQVEALRQQAFNLNQRNHDLQAQLQAPRYRLADHLNDGVKRLPFVQQVMKRILRKAG